MLLRMINAIRMTCIVHSPSLFYELTVCSLCSDRGMMDNGGFCNDNYHSLSSDDELVDISDVTVDFSEDVPPLNRDYSVGRDTLTHNTS